MKNRKLLIFNIVTILVFLAVTMFLLLRSNDATGATMNTSIRIINVVIWAIPFVVVWLIEWTIVVFQNHND
ncbi:DUF3923 family protein [Convivina intestini]|uniref:DUF3923 family protein n=1 Tax=Convivina intestini TaxID=1505726 RepID=UPI002015ADE0|nr:hypothetical protein R078131_00650 [Convivina intestini]